MPTANAGRERERGRDRERKGFPKMETLKISPSPKIESSHNALPISVDYNFRIRAPIYVYFVSTDSVRRDLQLSCRKFSQILNGIKSQPYAPPFKTIKLTNFP